MKQANFRSKQSPFRVGEAMVNPRENDLTNMKLILAVCIYTPLPGAWPGLLVRNVYGFACLPFDLRLKPVRITVLVAQVQKVDLLHRP